MTFTSSDHINLLAAVAWDLRATVEAQLRSLTALQRSLDEYRDTGRRGALDEITRHLDSIDSRMDPLCDGTPRARQSLAALQQSTAVAGRELAVASLT